MLIHGRTMTNSYFFYIVDIFNFQSGISIKPVDNVSFKLKKLF